MIRIVRSHIQENLVETGIRSPLIGRWLEAISKDSVTVRWEDSCLNVTHPKRDAFFILNKEP